MIRLVPIRPLRLFDKGRRSYLNAPCWAHPSAEIAGFFFHIVSSRSVARVRRPICSRIHFPHRVTRTSPRRSIAAAEALRLQRLLRGAISGGRPRRAARGGHAPVSRPEEERRRLAELPGPAFRRGRSPPCTGCETLRRHASGLVAEGAKEKRVWLDSTVREGGFYL